MGRRCFAPNCRSGYNSCNEKVFTFKAPNDTQRLQAWARAIPRGDRQLTSTDYICERHFADDMIKRGRYYSELGGEVILDRPKKPVLLPHAVPCIFPGCPPYLSSFKKRSQAPKSRSRTGGGSKKRGRVENFGDQHGGISDSGNRSQEQTEWHFASPVCEPDHQPNDAGSTLQVKLEPEISSSVYEPSGHPSDASDVDSTFQVKLEPEITLSVYETPDQPSGTSDAGSSLRVKFEPDMAAFLCVPTVPMELPLPLDASAQVFANVSPTDPDVLEVPDIKCSTFSHSVSDVSSEMKQHPCSSSAEACILQNLVRESEIVLPSRAWCSQNISTDGVESLCFVELKKASATSPIFVNKSLEVTVSQAGLKISRCVLGCEVSSTVVQTHGQMLDVPDIIVMLDAFHNTSVCRGGPAWERYSGIQLKCASVDNTGHWRHKRCPFLLDTAETQCVFCERLHNTMRVHKSRKSRAERRPGLEQNEQHLD